MFETETKPAAPANAELERLAGEARAADAAPGAQPGAEAQLPPGAHALTPAESWSQVPAIFGRILGRWFPEMNAIYTDQANLEWGRNMVPLAERYGWTADKFFAWLGPWAGLAIASEALITPTYLALAARYQAAKEAQLKAEQPPSA